MIKNKNHLINPDEFMNPSAEFRLHSMEHSISEDYNNVKPFLVETGAGGGVINCSWKDGWNFNPKNRQKLFDTAKKIKEHDLRVWLYDDVVYPSGWAGGYILNAGGKHIAQNIGVIVKEGSGTDEFEMPLPENGIRFLSATIFQRGTNGKWDYESPTPVKMDLTNVLNVYTICPEGEWQVLYFYIRWCNTWHYAWPDTISWPNGPRVFLNLLNRDAVSLYIKGALQIIADEIEQPLGELFDAVFTDEPSLCSYYIYGHAGKSSFRSVPYGDELFSRFSEMHRYDLTQVLHYLFFGDGIKAATTRIHFYRTITDLLKRNFTGQVSQWCRDNGTRFSGHILSEERLDFHVGCYGDYMEVVSALDWPGYDCCESIHEYYWSTSPYGSNYLTGKFTSSATRGKGINDTMVELCPHSHNTEFLKDQDTIFDYFMSMTTDAVFTGATHINVYAYRYIHSSEKHKRWNEYTGRLCSVLREAVSMAAVAVYYPIADAQAFLYAPDAEMDDISDDEKRLRNYLDSLVNNLIRNRFDFNFITERMVIDSSLNEDKICLHGMEYKAIIMPFTSVVPLAVMYKLEEFKNAGGTVYFLDKLPIMGIEYKEHKKVCELAKRLSEGAPVEFRPDNLAFRARVTASSVADGFCANAVTNGAIEARFSPDKESWRGNELPAVLTLEMSDLITFNRIDLFSSRANLQQQYKVEAEVNGVWELLVESSENAIDNHVIKKVPLVTARRVRITLDPTDEQTDISGLAEVQLCRIYDSPKESMFFKDLLRVASPSLIVEGSRPGAILMSHYQRDGRPFHLIINSSIEYEIFSLRDSAGKHLRIYNPETGKISLSKMIQSLKLAPGRALLVEPVEG